ncbi:MAG: hypothetical protein J7L66_06320 [Anaerolineaceae bacterium]|nr:hypothetical protein [Anaerolineaceae bacterium]
MRVENYRRMGMRRAFLLPALSGFTAFDADEFVVQAITTAGFGMANK